MDFCNFDRLCNCAVMGGAVVLIALVIAVPCAAQQTADGRPLEYIESSSPLEGGGVVTSIQYPGQAPLAYQTAPIGNETSGRIDAQSGNARSVLVQSAPAPMAPTAQAPAATVAQLSSMPPNLAVPSAMPQTTIAQVPTLGTPTSWNRSLRPWCGGCTAPPVYAPANMTGASIPAASIPPTLAAPNSWTTNSPTWTAPAGARPVYTPLVQLQNFPPNAYPGQGILGSPKMYVDGQPIRNLMRYLIIP